MNPRNLLLGPLGTGVSEERKKFFRLAMAIGGSGRRCWYGCGGDGLAWGRWTSVTGKPCPRTLGLPGNSRAIAVISTGIVYLMITEANGTEMRFELGREGPGRQGFGTRKSHKRGSISEWN
ncbi:hypothetical protein L1987_37528 [Smallanthus sonchifolius]|uniref:Uncharacterized protein n=1 Tax=Smallanthus sonchifolius TaxID=185202 RepID=A0ACB9HGK1_9ASTR|nr:hypothetical protein L1987_37528 [Smallanthus sonchifolius]